MFANFNDNNNDDFLDEFRQKLNSEPGESFEERKNEINRSKNVFIGTVSGIALAAVVGWFVLSPRYAAENTADIPVIRRPQTAVKVQPAEPGGMEILNQDKSVYDIIEKKDTAAPAVENLLPPPEEPQLPTVSAAAEPNLPAPAPAVRQAEEIIKAEDIKIAPAPEPKAAPEEAPKPEPATIAQAAAAPVEKAPEAAPQKTESKPAETKPVAPAVKAPETKTEVKTVAVSGPWQVQLISSPNRKAVDTAWDGLVKKYPVLKSQPREIETADLGAKGTFYRLKAGGFAERAGADRLCNDIKALGGTCIVKKK